MIDSKMQKIVDAINYLRADLSNSFDGTDKWDEILIVDGDGDYLTTTGHYSSLSTLICTIEEFNQCVKEMSAAAWVIPKAPANPTYEKVTFDHLWQAIKAVEDDTDTYYFKHKSIYIELDDTDVATAVFKTKQYEFYKLVDELEQKAIAEYEKLCSLLDTTPDWNGRSLNVKANYYAMVEKNVTVTRK